MPKTLRLAATAVAVALLAAGCAKGNTGGTGTPPTLPTQSTTIPRPTTTAAAGPDLNERGMIVKALGQEAGFGANDTSSVTFTIDKVTVDPPCDEFGIRPDSGHTLLLEVRVATGADADAASYMSGILNPFSFSEIGKDGVTRNAQAGSCTDYTKALPSEFGVNQKYAGTIEIVVPEASGILALQEDLRNGGGWEWRY